jgi:ATP-binding cassette subfamily B protein/subfamily B ATP-binding cassette protein MsbA
MSDESKEAVGSRNGPVANRARSSRKRYRGFVQDYQEKRLDQVDGEPKKEEEGQDGEGSTPRPAREKRREYLRDYFRWLWPHRYAVGTLFLFALLAAGLQMVEPLFMRFIIDRVLLNNTLDGATRLSHSTWRAPCSSASSSSPPESACSRITASGC